MGGKEKEGEWLLKPFSLYVLRHRCANSGYRSTNSKDTNSRDTNSGDGDTNSHSGDKSTATFQEPTRLRHTIKYAQAMLTSSSIATE